MSRLSVSVCSCLSASCTGPWPNKIRHPARRHNRFVQIPAVCPHGLCIVTVNPKCVCNFINVRVSVESTQFLLITTEGDSCVSKYDTCVGCSWLKCPYFIEMCLLFSVWLDCGCCWLRWIHSCDPVLFCFYFCFRDYSFELASREFECVFCPGITLCAWRDG